MSDRITNMGFLKNARRNLTALHEQRAAQVVDHCSYSDMLADSGSARAESVPGIPKPVGNQDFGGFIVVTSSRMIYRDYRAVVVITFNRVRSLSTFSHPLPMTTGLNVEFFNGERYQFSGNSPFIKKLVREFNQGNIPLPGADFSDLASDFEDIRGPLDDYFANLKSQGANKVSPTKSLKNVVSKASKSKANPKYRSLSAVAWVSVKDVWVDENLIYEDPAWLISWDSKEVDLLPKRGFRSFQECLDNSVDKDFINLLTTGAKKRSIACQPGFIMLALPGKSEFQAKLTSRSAFNSGMAERF